MIDKVAAAIEKYDMIKPESRVVAAVSGGSDSMAMLAVLNELKEKYNFTLEAAHVNHCLRGADADADEEYVRSICAEWEIPFHLLRADVADIAKREGKSLEEAGRKVRYDFFSSFGDDVIIATAHNLNDRAETFLFNFARGSALRGLCSIPAKRDNIIRPLINCSKKEIVEFCESREIKYVTDKTNSDIKYTRNRIRHNVITELENVNTAFEESAARCIDALNEDEKFLSSLADEHIEKYGLSAEALAAAPVPVRNRAIIKIIERETGVTPEYGALMRVAAILGGGACETNGGIRVRVRHGFIEFPQEPERCDEQAEFENGMAVCCGVEFYSEIINVTNNLQNILKERLEYFLDYDKIVGKLTVRCRKEGDKIRLYPSGCTKSLKKLFNEKAVEPEKRNVLPMLADENGIILIPGIGFDCRVKVTAKTERVIKIRVEK